MTTSFKKKTTSRGRVNLPNGTRPSFSNNQLIVSSGIASLDSLLGGGLAVGTILLVEEDHDGAFAELVLKYFLAEGAVCGHSLYVSSQEKSTHTLVKSLPGSTKNDSTQQMTGKNPSDDSLQIAWRYKNLGQEKVNPRAEFCHTFDLSSTMTIEDLERSTTYHCCLSDDDHYSEHQPSFFNTSYGKVLQDISRVIADKDLSTSIVRAEQNIMRVALHAFGSPSWEDHDAPNKISCLSWFLVALKAQLRKAYGVAIVTVPVHLFEDPSIASYLEHVCDAAIAIESFAGSDKEKNPAFKDYHGLLKVKKLPCVNSIATVDVDTTDLAFKLKRKKFCIEKLHLPPELSETANRTQSDPAEVAKKSGIPLCGISAKSLDF